MVLARHLAAAVMLACASMGAHAANPKPEVIHWWTSSSEAAAVRTIADAYRKQGGVWADTAIAGADHTFSRRVWRDQVASWTAAWVRSW